jgi:hypothetical protein
LVPESAREALGKQEVQRQSVIFEIFKAEREYVSDLETVEEVCHFMFFIVAHDRHTNRSLSTDYVTLRRPSSLNHAFLDFSTKLLEILRRF